MKTADALHGLTRLLLDTAPIIYYVERHPRYLPVVAPFFQAIDSGALIAVVSPITLAECLIIPLRTGATDLQRNFLDLMLNGSGTEFQLIDGDCAERAADIRARYNLTLLDAFQIAVAMSAGCEALLTNDTTLRRAPGMRILIADELEL